VSNSVVLSQVDSPRRCLANAVDEYGDGYVHLLQVDLEDAGLVAHG
jgi:hypothetical protein